jgi:hypothetical protein
MRGNQNQTNIANINYEISIGWLQLQGLVNVLIEHHPTIGDIITNKYLKVMFKLPKTGHLPTPDLYTGLNDFESHIFHAPIHLDAVHQEHVPNTSQHLQ